MLYPLTCKGSPDLLNYHDKLNLRSHMILFSSGFFSEAANVKVSGRACGAAAEKDRSGSTEGLAFSVSNVKSKAYGLADANHFRRRQGRNQRTNFSLRNGLQMVAVYSTVF